MFIVIVIVIVCCSHFSVTRNPVMWRVVGHLQDFVNGTSYYVWVYQVRFTAKAFNLSFAPLQKVAHRHRRPCQQQGKYFKETNTFNNRAAITKTVKLQVDCKQLCRVLVDFFCSACLWGCHTKPVDYFAH